MLLKVSDSVVGINVTQIKKQSIDPFFDPTFFIHFLIKIDLIKENLGSGVIISEDDLS